jgi:hypothetical protein
MVKSIHVAIALVCMAVVLAVIIQPVRKEPHTGNEAGDIIKLPEPLDSGEISVEEALLERRSIRNYKDEALTLAEISQLLWAAQGITDPGGYRTAPSAGALYPLEVYVVTGNVEGLQAGIYKYRPQLSCVRQRLTRNLLRTVRQYWYLLRSMNERPGSMASGG